MELFLANYIKAGLIGWGVWFVLAIGFVISSFGTDISLYRSEENKKKTKWTLGDVIALVLWPIGILRDTHLLVRYVSKRKEEVKNGRL